MIDIAPAAAQIPAFADDVRSDTYSIDYGRMTGLTAAPTGKEARQAKRIAANPDLTDMTDADLTAEIAALKADYNRIARITRTHRTARRSPAQAARAERLLAAETLLNTRANR